MEVAVSLAADRVVRALDQRLEWRGSPGAPSSIRTCR